MFVRNENWSEIHLSFSSSTYSFSVRHYSVVRNFFKILKKYRVSAQNPKGLAFGFTEKTYVPGKNGLKIHISSL
jgi:hypothetical protein